MRWAHKVYLVLVVATVVILTVRQTRELHDAHPAARMAGRIKGFFDRSEDSEDDMIADLSAADGAVIAPPKLRSSSGNFSSGNFSSSRRSSSSSSSSSDRDSSNGNQYSETNGLSGRLSALRRGDKNNIATEKNSSRRFARVSTASFFDAAKELFEARVQESNPKSKSGFIGDETVASPPRRCAVFFVYGGVLRYEEEVLRTIGLLKKLDPDVRSILVSDTLDRKELAPGEPDPYADVDSFHVIPTPPQKSWLPRLKFVSQTMEKKFRDCDVTIALDSHVTVCSSNLRERMESFLADSSNVLGANVEHAPQKPWYASPFRYFLEDRGGMYNAHCHKYLPHNFAVIFRRSKATQAIMGAWWNKMNGNHGDDQRPLMKAIEAEKFPFTRLSESFAFALKSVDKGRFGMWPRFTYLVPAGEPVTLVHSYDTRRIPNNKQQDFCQFINANVSASRMIFQVSARERVLLRRKETIKFTEHLLCVQERAGKFYEILTSYAQCEEKLRNYDSRLCAEMDWLLATTGPQQTRPSYKKSHPMAKVYRSRNLCPLLCLQHFSGSPLRFDLRHSRHQSLERQWPARHRRRRSRPCLRLLSRRKRVKSIN